MRDDVDVHWPHFFLPQPSMLTLSLSLFLSPSPLLSYFHDTQIAVEIARRSSVSIAAAHAAASGKRKLLPLFSRFGLERCGKKSASKPFPDLFSLSLSLSLSHAPLLSFSFLSITKTAAHNAAGPSAILAYWGSILLTVAVGAAAAASVQRRERSKEEEEEVEREQQRRLRSGSSASSPSSSSTQQQLQQRRGQQQREARSSASSSSSKQQPQEEDALATLEGVDVFGSRLLLREAPRRAARFASEAHGGQLRRSGEPYVTHCVETAKIVEAILADFYQDGGGGGGGGNAAAAADADAAAEAAVVAALLHDVPDDTPIPISTLAAEFGGSVGGLVSAVSRLSRTYQLLRRRDSSGAAAAEERKRKQQAPTLSATAVDASPSSSLPPLEESKEKEKTEEEEERERDVAASMSRAMVVASVDEPLCLVIKLADRLHNMRTAWALPSRKREAVAAETLRTWCPLAGRLGLFALQAELEDLCFAVADPSGYSSVRATLDAAGTELAQMPAVAVTGGGSGPRGPRGRGGARSGGFGGGGGLLTVSAAAAAAASTSSAATALAPPPPLQQEASLLSPPPPPLPQLALPQAPEAAHALGEDAARCASLLMTVPPFDVTTFERPPGRGARARRRAAAAATAAAAAALLSSSSSSSSAAAAAASGSSSSSFPLPPGAAPRALGDLWAAAGLLLREVAVESQATGLDVRVQGRLKSALSVSRKARRKGQRPQDVLDARALRVVVTPPREGEGELGSGGGGGGRRRNDGIPLAAPLAAAAARGSSPSSLPSPSSPGEAAAVAACYRILPTVHRLWRPISGEADDYIVSPKPSGYRSLHTAVWGGRRGGIGVGRRSTPNPSADSPSSSSSSSSPSSSSNSFSSIRKGREVGAPMEVQLRTGAMHAAAEHGAAAHWAYKEAPPIQSSSSNSNSTKSLKGTTTMTTASDAATAALAAVAKVAATGAARIASSLDGGAVGSSSSVISAPRLRRGDPLARVSGGKLQLGAVLRCSDDEEEEEEESSEGGGSGGLALRVRRRRRRSALVAVRVAPRLDPSAGPPPRAAVAALLEAAERGGWDAPGRGDLGAKVEEFSPGGDGRWHRVDAYGRMLPAVVMPLVAEEGEEEE